MALTQEDDLIHHRHDLQRLSSDGECSSTAVAPAPTLSVKDPTNSTSFNATASTTTLSSTSTPPHQQDDPRPSEGTADKNWARVRQRLMGNGSILNLNKAGGSGDKKGASLTIPLSMSASRPHSSHTTTDVFKIYPVMESSGPGPSGRKTVLGFRTVVVQRTQLRKMEKEIEKALQRHSNDQSQPRSRSVTRIGTGRGMITGAPYNFMAMQEVVSVDKSLLEELTEIFQRWKNLTVEVPCRKNILRALAKMLRADTLEPSASRLDSSLVLNLFELMRQLYPLQYDPEDLQDVLWCLGLLSSKYACHKDRVIATLEGLLKPDVLMASLPLASGNIQELLATIIKILNEQHKLPQEKQDRQVQNFITGLMDQIRVGDLGTGRDIANDPSLHEYYARVAFLKGLIQCLRQRDQDITHFIINNLIPKYWVETDPNYPLVMDEPVQTIGQIANDIVMSAPVVYEDASASTQSLVLDLVRLLAEYVPPAGLNGNVSKDAVAMIARFILAVFSIEYRGKYPKASTDAAAAAEEGPEVHTRQSTSAESELINGSRTPPRSPLSPDTSGGNSQAHSRISHASAPGVQEQSTPLIQRARMYFNGLWEHGYRDLITDQLLSEAENIPFRRLVNMYHQLVLGSANAVSSPILAATLDIFFKKLVADQPEPTDRLSQLLIQLSIRHRATFYKPMIACVASDSTQFVVNYLSVLSCLEAHMSLVDLFMKDVDMICVIAMTDVGPERPRSDSPTQGLKWGSCTVGQCVIILEFIYAIKKLASSGDKHRVEIGKMFLIDLERKLGLYLISKEKTILVPRPMRVMLCLIFHEIRMLCKTIHRPGWLPRVLDWAIHYNDPGASTPQGSTYGFSDTLRLRVKHIYNNVDSLLGERRERFISKLTNAGTNVTSSTSTKKRATTSDVVVNGQSRTKPFLRPEPLGRIQDIQMDEAVAILKLLITVQSVVQDDEYLGLLDPLWNAYCLESRSKVASLAAFLFVKCASLAPKATYTLISRDLTSNDPFKRQSSVERLTTLFDHRNELLAQPYVVDPSVRGPFRSLNVQVPFVSSEVGSNRYTMDEPRWLTELKSISDFPVDIRMRFEELAWTERGHTERELMKRVQTPLMLSWTGYLDEDSQTKENFGKTHVVSKDRHAPVMVPVLSNLYMAVIDLVDDQSIGVRSASINFLSNYMRNEPVLFVRWLLAELAQSRSERQRDLVYKIQLLLSASSKLPPAFAFSLFNHLLGLLKWYQRNSKPHGLEMMVRVLPLLADILSSTNDIVYKDFKRNKVDVFFANLGRFWFRPNISPETMFPHRLWETSLVLPRLGVPNQLLQMAITNINRIQFMTTFVIRFPLEVSDMNPCTDRFIRMPTLDSAEAAIGSKTHDNQLFPDVSSEKDQLIIAMSNQGKSIHALSSLRARAWLCYALNLIQRMERNSIEHPELVNIFSSVNMILLEHGYDHGVIGQALDVYVTAATHLRRFFTSHNGYTLMFPAIFKVYCDSSDSRVVQDAIDAAFHRFYLLHQEAFLLQCLGTIVPMMLRNMSSCQSKIMARCLFEFMEALDHPMTSYQSKSLGVPSLAEPFHQSSQYGGPQLEIPDWMSSFISKDSKLFQSSNLLHKHEFTVADSFKLFLAVIVYDTGSVRSEQFVRILRLVLPHFQEREPELVANGLCSLAEAFSRFARTSKPLVPPSFVPPAVAPLSHQYPDDTTWNFSQFSLLGKLSGSLAVKGMTWAQNDRVAIKHEFVCLVQEYCDRGGQLIDVQHQQLAMLIRSLIKDYTLLKIPCTTDWIKEYVCRVILPTQSPQLAGRAGMHLTVQFSYGIRAHYKLVDFSGLMKGLALVVEDHRHFLRSSLEFSNLLRERIVITALSLALKGEWHTASIHVSQAKFCSSLVDLLLAMVNHCDADTLAELELASPSPRLMAYIIIPMCLRFKTRSSTRCLDVLEMQFWLRMLGLTIRSAECNATLRRSSRIAGLFAPVINAARVSNKRQPSMEMTSPLSSQQQTATLAPSVLLSPSVGMIPPTPGLSRISSILNRDDQPEEDPQTQPSDASMNVSPGLLVDFIALRIILVRGERYLSYHPGCWLDIFNIVKKYFSVHAFMKSAFSGSSSSRHGRQASFNGSGPSSPNVMSPFPLSPRLDGPRVPDLWQGGGGSGGITPFPGLFRQSNDISPGARTGSHKETVPTTALGYLLWTFAETIVLNCLPLMVVMRPYLLDQLRQVQDQQQVSTLRTSRSAGSSGPSSPAFYWPSPAILSSGQFGPGLSPWNVPSPSHRRTDSGASQHTREQPDSAKQQPKADRKKQWKGWSRPSETLSPTTPMDKPYSSLSSPMSPHQSPQGHQRQRSPMSFTSENPSTSHTTPRTGLHGHFWGHHKHHQRSESDANNININANSNGNNNGKAKHLFPKVLVDRANKSLERVRAILLSSASTNAAAYSENRSGVGPGIFPFPPTPSGLSPSMARQSPVERRRDNSPFPSSDPLTSQSNDHHFLHPGKYEPHPHPPISPGFGTMFLAREAAIKDAGVSSPSQSSPEQTVGQGSPASMSAPQSRTLAIPGTPGTENGRPPMGSIAGSPDRVNITLGKSRADSAEASPNIVLEVPHSARTVTPGELSISTPVTPSKESTALTVEGSSTVSGLPSKNSRRGILKPTLTTEGDTNQQQSQMPSSSPSLAVHGPVRQDTYPIRRFDSRNTEDGVSFASGVGDSMCEKEPGITAQEQGEYSVAGLRARTKAFIQNIEEETRMVLACFPSVFMIGCSPPDPSTTTAAVSTIVGTAESTEAKNQTNGIDANSVRGTSHVGQEATQSKEGTSTVNTPREKDSDTRIRSKTPSLTVPPRRTPSITIQDSSSLLDPTPMPFISLPLILENGESLPQSESPDDMIRSAKEENGQPDRVSFAIPPSTAGSAKERRSKSVLFHPSSVLEQLKKVGNGTDGRESDGGIIHRKSNGQGLGVTISSSQLQLNIARPPVLSFAESLPPVPVLSPPLPREPNLSPSNSGAAHGNPSFSRLVTKAFAEEERAEVTKENGHVQPDQPLQSIKPEA